MFYNDTRASFTCDASALIRQAYFVLTYFAAKSDNYGDPQNERIGVGYFRPSTSIPIQHVCVSRPLVCRSEMYPSFSFCQVDMYDVAYM